MPVSTVFILGFKVAVSCSNDCQLVAALVPGGYGWHCGALLILQTFEFGQRYQPSSPLVPIAYSICMSVNCKRNLHMHYWHACYCMSLIACVTLHECYCMSDICMCDTAAAVIA